MWRFLIIFIFKEVLCQNSATNSQNSNPSTFNNQNYDSSSQLGAQNSPPQYSNTVYQRQQPQYNSQNGQSQQNLQNPQFQPQSNYIAPNEYSAPANQQSILNDFGPTVAPDSQNFVVMNPNARFLPEGLYDTYVNSYNQPKLYDTAPTTTEPPILSNQDQNVANYQAIQSQPQSSTPLYTNNIYGYDYRSNPTDQYTYVGNNAQYQPPLVSRYQPPQGSPFGRKKRDISEGKSNNTIRIPIPQVIFALLDDSNENSTNTNDTNDDGSNKIESFQPEIATDWADESWLTREKRLNGIGTFTHQEPMYDPATNAAFQARQGQFQGQNQANYNPAGQNYQGVQYNPPNQGYQGVQYNPSSNGIQPYAGTNMYYPYRTDVDYPSGPPTADYYQYSLSGRNPGVQYNPSNTGSTSSASYSAPQYNYPNTQIYAGASVVGPNSPNYQQVLQQDQQALNNYQDPNCTGQDPYWCAQYVKDFVGGLTTYDNANQQAACQQLVSSLQFSDNRCCQAVRANGCSN